MIALRNYLDNFAIEVLERAGEHSFLLNVEKNYTEEWEEILENLVDKHTKIIKGGVTR